jgi:hypothetical protein
LFLGAIGDEAIQRITAGRDGVGVADPAAPVLDVGRVLHR